MTKMNHTLCPHNSYKQGEPQANKHVPLFPLHRWNKIYKLICIAFDSDPFPFSLFPYSSYLIFSINLFLVPCLSLSLSNTQKIKHRQRPKHTHTLMKQPAAKSSLRRLCPNINKEDGLETVLEIPIPEEMFSTMGNNVALRWQNMLTWMKAQTEDKLATPTVASRLNELRFLLYLVGCPLIPLQVQLGHSVHRPVRDCSIVRTYTFFSILGEIEIVTELRATRSNFNEHITQFY